MLDSLKFGFVFPLCPQVGRNLHSLFFGHGVEYELIILILLTVLIGPPHFVYLTSYGLREVEIKLLLGVVATYFSLYLP